MSLKKIFTPLLLFVITVLTACNNQVDESNSTATQGLSAKISSETTELNFSVHGQFITEIEQIPCNEYAFESEICNNDSNGVVDNEWNFLEMSIVDLNAEQISALNRQVESMVKKEEDAYLINLGCRGDNQIEGSEYGIYQNEELNDAFEQGAIYIVNFDINIAPEAGDPSCASPVKQFNSMFEAP